MPRGDSYQLLAPVKWHDPGKETTREAIYAISLLSQVIQMSRKIRVLHVDDDPQFSALTIEFLATIDDRLDLESIHDPNEASSIINADDFDCIVSDYDMPSMNGIEFLKEVRAQYIDLPFILFTGKGSEEVASDAISAGVTDYLQKSPGTDQFHLLANRITNAVEQQWATDAAEETERRLRELAENTTDVLWMFSADWQELLFVNSVVTDIFEISASELYRHPTSFLEIIHPPHREQVERAMEQVTQGYPIELEFQIIPRSCSPRWVWVSGEPILDEEGDVVRIVGFTRDITDRKRRERERREAARRLDIVLDSVQACIWMRDADRRFLLANEQFYRDFDLDQRVDVVGHLSEDLFDPEEFGALTELDDEVLTSASPLKRECELPVSGQLATYLVRITPLFDEFGDLSATCGIATDITDHKQREQRLQSQSEQLTAIVKVISGDLLTAVETDDRDPLPIIESLSAIATNNGPTLAPVDLSVFPLSVDGVDDFDSEAINSGDAPTIVGDQRLLDQLFRTLLSGVDTGASADSTLQICTVESGFVVTAGHFEPPMFRDSQSQQTKSGLEEQFPVIRWIAQQHGWTMCIESREDSGVKISFENVEFF